MISKTNGKYDEKKEASNKRPFLLERRRK